MSGRDFTERDIHMALDGELPGEERAAYEAWLNANPEMKARSLRYAADVEALRTAFAGVADEPVPARLTRAVFGEAPARPRQPTTSWPKKRSRPMLSTPPKSATPSKCRPATGTIWKHGCRSASG